jgi:hypothetical protein
LQYLFGSVLGEEAEDLEGEGGEEVLEGLEGLQPIVVPDWGRSDVCSGLVESLGFSKGKGELLEDSKCSAVKNLNLKFDGGSEILVCNERVLGLGALLNGVVKSR